MTNTIELAGIVVVRDGRLLVAHRNTPTLKQYEIIGGKRKKGETLAQTAIREEADIEVRILGESSILGFVQQEQQYEYHFFPAEIVAGEPRVLEPHMHDAIMFANTRSLRLSDEASISPPLNHVIDELHHGRYERYFPHG